jgi:hypothetical protein
VRESATRDAKGGTAEEKKSGSDEEKKRRFPPRQSSLLRAPPPVRPQLEVKPSAKPNDELPISQFAASTSVVARSTASKTDRASPLPNETIALNQATSSPESVPPVILPQFLITLVYLYMISF